MKPFLKHTAETVKTQSAVEFKLLKGIEAEFLLAEEAERTLALYKSLKEMGVRVEITPEGVKVDGETMWVLVAMDVERSVPGELPAEVMPSTELLKAYSASGLKLYIFRTEGVHYYFAVRTGQEWRAAGGKYFGRHVHIVGEAARVVADAINAIYSEMGVERRVEVKQLKNKKVPYINLTDKDLRLLDLTRP